MGAFARGSSSATSLDVFSFRLGRRWTTVRLEPALIAALRRIAIALGCSVSELATEITIARGEGSLTSAFRTFIVHYYENRGGVNDAHASDGTTSREAIERIVAGAKREDWLERTIIDVNGKEAAANLASYHQFWVAKKPAGGSALSSDVLDPDVIDRCGLRGYVHTVDADVDDPLKYRYRNWAGNVTLGRPRDFAGTCVGNFPMRKFRALAVEDYYVAVATGRPWLFRVRAAIGSSRYAYQRLLLPLATARGKPDMLLVALSVDWSEHAP